MLGDRVRAQPDERLVDRHPELRGDDPGRLMDLGPVRRLAGEQLVHLSVARPGLQCQDDLTGHVGDDQPSRPVLAGQHPRPSAVELQHADSHRALVQGKREHRPHSRVDRRP